MTKEELKKSYKEKITALKNQMHKWAGGIEVLGSLIEELETQNEKEKKWYFIVMPTKS